jgi:hypothetical protein
MTTQSAICVRIWRGHHELRVHRKDITVMIWVLAVSPGRVL